MFLFFDAQIVEESIFFVSKTVESMKKKEGRFKSIMGSLAWVVGIGLGLGLGFVKVLKVVQGLVKVMQGLVS